MKLITKMKKLNIILFAITIVSLGIAQDGISAAQLEAIKKLTENINTASDFTLSSLEDSIYTLSKMKDKVVLVNFWATWCGPCRMEIPDFNELYLKHHKEGFEILGIAMDGTKKSLKNFTKSYKMEYPILYGSARDLNKVSMDYGGVMSLPTSILIGKNNEVIRTYPGAILKSYNPQQYATFVYEIEKALSKK
ncbi:MAG: TlpA family protein disulfide reductase [Candidatus Marinimicrobia bacterium]|nr:TlpA family protein disulfide reductase [Candidatus Neomarinimicrobiota bacterium]MBT7376962.1 TlpA family protein disulfide reductase [Candidatus Neomarinimicrobiota bacterium]